MEVFNGITDVIKNGIMVDSLAVVTFTILVGLVLMGLHYLKMILVPPEREDKKDGN